MGCCQSSPKERVQNNNSTNVQDASMVVTKAPSPTFENNAEPSHAITSSSPPPSIGDEPLATMTTVEPEKIPVAAETEAEAEAEADHSMTKSDILVTADEYVAPPSITPPPPPPTTTTSMQKTKPLQEEMMGGPWSVIIRLSNTGQDIHVPISVQEPYMTITQLKQHIQLEPDQQVKLIHLGHILKDTSMLIPRTTAIQSSDNTVQVSNQGVIQAMVYKLSSI